MTERRDDRPSDQDLEQRGYRVPPRPPKETSSSTKPPEQPPKDK